MLVRSTCLVAGCAILVLIGTRFDLGAAPATSDIRPIVDRYCLGCHNPRLKSGGLALDAASAGTPALHPDIWERVVRKLDHRQMPPVGMPRPDETTYRTVMASLVSELDEAASKQPRPGRTATFRRLTRNEYRNAIRDLLSVDIDASALLPADESSNGFDNITVADLSPTLLERYLAAARKISRLAAGTPVRAPAEETVLIAPDLTQEDHFEGLPFGTRGGSIVPHTFPVDGLYEIRLRLARDRDERVEGLTTDPHQLDVRIDGERAALFTIKPVPRGQDHSKVDQDLNFKLKLPAGPHSIAAAFVKKTAALIETERQPNLAHFNADRHPRIQPALYSVSIAGPYDGTRATQTPARRQLFVCTPETESAEEGCARQILSTFMRRAWRRDVSEAEVAAPLKFYREGRGAVGFDNGIEMAVRALMVSPQFLFRIEKDGSAAVYPVNQFELASRLSFFLWSSIPDDELLDAAASGRLRSPETLREQVRRMLADPRSETLVTNFASQWLFLKNLDSATPDPRLFPDFDQNLRHAFRRETELFVDSVVREDRNVLDLLRAKYTFLNERLAKHYGIPGVYGSRFRRVSLEGQPRGGLLTQGGILTVTSYATRTSPVLRGKWVLANILGTPPAPPPPKLPPLEATNAAGKVLTGRERIAQHRANPACAGCHNIMDPIGFAFENYDAVGAWRVKDEGGPVDASGMLPDGTKFNGAEQLQQALLSRPEHFVSTVTEKLITYALGRAIEPADAPTVRKIVQSAAREDYRFSAVIEGIVSSAPFQMRSSR